MIGFLFRNLKGYRFLMVVAVVMSIAQVGASILLPFSLKIILEKIVPPTKDPFTDPNFSFLNGPVSFFDRFSMQLPPHGQVHTVLGVILFSVAAVIVLAVLRALLQYIELYLAAFIGQNLSARLRKQLFAHLERLSLDWHGKQKKGDLVQRITGNITDIEKLVTDGLVDVMTAILTIAGVVVVMLLINRQFTILSVVILPPLIISVFGYTASIKAASKKASKAAGQVANVATEDIGAITVLKAFTLEEREDLRFRKYVVKNRAAGLRAGGLQAQFTPIVAILTSISTAIIIGVGTYVVAGNTFTFWFLTIPAFSLTVGSLTVFLSFLALMYQPIRNVSKLAYVYNNASSGAERIQEVLDAAPEVVESATHYHGPTKLKGDIIFDHVVFSYSPNRPVLKGINLHIAAGKKVALVGLSGGGKTTLVKLISRFYEIQQGAVKIDGVENRVYPLDILRQNVSMVLQDNVLFEGNVRENIEIGKPGASMEEIIDAAKQAYVHETIVSLPDGYETEVREQGKNFSGGQRQRLAIARAILRDSPILILDEPTAALDVEAEAEVMHALDKLVVGRTVLMISHRLSTLGNVDEVIVLKGGRIVEQGGFQELKRKGGVFAALLEEQNRYNADRVDEKSIIRSAFTPLPINNYNDQAQVPPSPRRQPMQPVPPPPVPIPVTPQQQPLRLAPVPPQAFPVNQQPVNYQNARQPEQAPMRNQFPHAAPTRIARILIEVDGKIIGEHPLNKPMLTVGRLSGNDVQVPSQRVSRLHAKIRWENGVWLIEDAESVNGLMYQGSRVERLVLSDGDRVYVAPTAILHYKDT